MQYLNIVQTVLSATFFTTASCFCICTLCTCNIYIRFIRILLCFFYVCTSYPVIFSPLCKHLYCYLYLHTCTYVIVMCPLLSLPGHCSGVGDGHGVCFPQQDWGCCCRWWSGAGNSEEGAGRVSEFRWVAVCGSTGKCLPALSYLEALNTTITTLQWGSAGSGMRKEWLYVRTYGVRLTMVRSHALAFFFIFALKTASASDRNIGIDC